MFDTGVAYQWILRNRQSVELSFEWHAAKAAENLKKHGISFEEAKTIFNDPFSITVADPQHSDDEDRFIDIGLSTSGQLLVVVSQSAKVSFV